MANKQKIAVIIPDGAADLNVPELNNKTPMQYAKKPCMDYLASNGVCGMVVNIPDGMISDASATANLAILGYDPKIYSKGRSPLEAASIGLEMKENDTAIRCNLVTLSENEGVYEEKTVIDHSADEITTEEADILIKELDKQLGTDKIRFHTGKSYRHILLWEDYPGDCKFTGPHDILNKQAKEYLPSGKTGEQYVNLMKKSYDILNNHPLNIKRRESGKRPANSIWLWSPGAKPDMPDFKSKYGLDGSVIAFVDLIQGLGIYAGMNVVEVEGATGNFHTNYKNKGLAAINEFENGKDFVFVHIEAPDECSHRLEIENKVKSIELIDADIIKPIYEYLNSNSDEFKILVLPDHPTFLSTGAHSYAPVPFLVYKKGADVKSGIDNFNEESVSQKSSLFIEHGYNLMDFVMKQ
ncbi:MAG: cofactor-independent phosphoglycerate mutase [Oscillospiraceae bacterium]|nr:cofactor-independent phosphoglycerate mutase [Oscillospiraceae bacterium]